MTNYGASIQLADKMTPILNSIITALDMTISTVYDMQSTVDGFDASGFDTIRETIAQAESEMQKIQNQTNENTNEQKKFNDSVKHGTTAVGGLENAVRNVASAFGLYKIGDIIKDGAQELISLSDDMTGYEARLSLNMDEGSLDTVKTQIYAAAQDSRGDYTDMMNSVSRLGLLAADAFSDPSGNVNYEEIIRFQELMNKNFAISGASVTEQSSAMYQLTQAMSAGKLQGDEYRSIIETAPLLTQSIEDYMRSVVGAQGTMKEWAAEGLLTADVIKNAVFSSADEVEARFETIPMTWSQVMTGLKNEAVVMFDPVLDKINELANNDEFIAVFNGAMDGLSRLVDVAMGAVDIVANGAIYVSENWDNISPILLGVTAALGFVAAAQLASAAATAIANSAWLASPVTWIAVAILALIVIIYKVIEAVSQANGSTTSAMGVIAGAISWTAALILNVVIGLINSILQVIWNVVSPILGIVEWILNACNGGFESFGGAVANLIGNIISSFLSMAKVITPIVDAIFGTDWTSGLSEIQNDVLSWGKTEDAITISREAPYIDYRLDMTDAYDWGYSLGEKAENVDVNDILNSLLDNTAGINNATSNIDDTISASSDDELEWLRKIAERENVNKYTTAEIKLDFSSTATINSDIDIDGFINTFTDELEAVLVTTAEDLEK